MNRLVNAPAREARETVEKMRNRSDINDKGFRLALFSLQKYIRVSITSPLSYEI